jgi:O-antigen/teichoic acid export membrane protein
MRLTNDKRLNKLTKNVIGSFFLQGINIIIGIIIVPLTITFVNSDNYAIWLTLSSILMWFSIFDIGFGSGLKNRLAEALAKNNYSLAKTYISTTYFSVGFLMLIAIFLFSIFGWYIDWSKVFNVDASMSLYLKKIVYIVMILFFFRFFLQLISNILTAFQLPVVASAISTISNILIVIIIFGLSKITTGNLLTLSIVMSAIPVLIYIFFSFYLYNTKYKNVSPSFHYIDKTKIKNLLGIGIKFFIIQISMIILFQSSNFLIIQLFGSDEVVQYNIAYKLFVNLSIVFSIVMNPFWVLFTDAWTRKEIQWIKQSIKKLLVIWLLISICGLIVLCYSDEIYGLWVGKKIIIPFRLSLFICVYFIIFIFGGVFNMFINGVGKLQLQLICLTVSSFIYIPMVLLFAKVFNMGLISIPIALILSNFYSIIIAPIQYIKLINGKAKGIFLK